MTLVGTAFINFEGQFDGVARDARRFGSKAGDDFGNDFGKRSKAGILGSFKQVAGAGAAIFAGAKVVSIFGDTITEAREAAKVTRLTNNVIKQTKGAANISAGAVGDLAEALSNKAGIDDEVIQTGANLLLTFKNVRNEAGKGSDVFNRATAAATDLSVQFGSVDSASKMLGKALNDPLKGVSALGRAGVTFSETQKKQIANFVETGDLLSAQKIILGEVESQVGGAAAAAADPMEKLSVVIGNLKERVGTALLPVIEKGATWLGQFLPTALDLAGRGFGFLVDMLTPVVGVAKQAFDILFKGDFKGGPLAEDSPVVDTLFKIRDGLGLLWGVGKQVFALLFSNDVKDGPLGLDSPFFYGIFMVRKFIVDKLIPTVGKIAGFLIDTLGAAFTWIADTAVPAVVGALGDLVSGFRDGAEGGFFGELGEKARVVFDWVTQTAIPGIKKAIGSFLDGIRGEGGEGSFFTDLGEGIASVADLFTDTLWPAAKKIFDWFTNLGKPVLIGIAIAFGAIVAPVLAVVAGVIYAYQKFDWFRAGVQTVFGVVKTIITTAVDVIAWTFTNVIGPAITWVVDLFKNYLIPGAQAVGTFFTTVLWPAMQTAWSAISAAISAAWGFIQTVFNAVVGFVQLVLIPAFNTYLGVMQFVWGLVWAVIQDAWDIVRPIFDAVIGFVRDSLIPQFNTFKDNASTVWTTVSGAVQTAWDLISPVLVTVVSYVKDTLIPVWDGIASAVSTAFNKVPEIIGSALRTAGNTVAGFMRGAAGIADTIGLDSIAGSLRSGADKADGWGEGSHKTIVGGRHAPPEFAAGGSVPPFITNGARAIVGEGNPRFPEYVIPTDPKYRGRAKSLWQQAGVQLLAGGGIIDDIKGKVGGGVDAVKGVAGDVVGALRKVAGGSLDKAWPKMDVGNDLLGLIPGGANYLRKGILDKIKGEADKKLKAEEAALTERNTNGSGLAASANGINPDFLARFRQWSAATGGKYSIGSGFRSSAQQAVLYRKYLAGNGPLAAPPGRSNHEKGLAIDTSPSRTSAADRALAAQFGLHFPLLSRGEPWHIEPFARGGVLPVSQHARNFDTGGTLNTGWNLVKNETGGPEPLVPAGRGPAMHVEHQHLHDGVDVDLMLQKLSARVRAGAL